MGRSQTQTGPTLSSPAWAGDFMSRDHLIPGGAKVDAAQFAGADAVIVTVGAAGAAGGATSVPVAALSGPIPSGTILDFTGSGKFAKLTAAAATGATTLTVEALPQALVSGDVATYLGVTQKTILSGTVVGRTIAERDASTPFGPAVDTDDEIYIVAFEVPDAADINDIELYRHNAVVKENFLPGWTGLAAGLKTAIRSRYRCVRGVD